MMSSGPCLGHRAQKYPRGFQKLETCLIGLESGRGGVRIRPLGKDLRQGRNGVQVSGPAEGAQQLGPGPVSGCATGFPGETPDDGNLALLCQVCERSGQRALADAGFTADQQATAMTCDQRIDARSHPRELGGSADEAALILHP